MAVNNEPVNGRRSADENRNFLAAVELDRDLSSYNLNAGAATTDAPWEKLMKLGFFIMPVHPPARVYAETLREDREAFILADRLGYSEGYCGEHLTDLAENSRRA